MKKWFFRTISSLVALVLMIGVIVSIDDKQTEKGSQPFNYSGYSAAVYNSYEKTSEYVKMTDGTKLAVDIYLPTDGPALESFPVIFQYTPYGRAFAIPDLQWYEKPFIKLSVGSWGPILDRANSFNTVFGPSYQCRLSSGGLGSCAGDTVSLSLILPSRP